MNDPFKCLGKLELVTTHFKAIIASAIDLYLFLS